MCWILYNNLYGFLGFLNVSILMLSRYTVYAVRSFDNYLWFRHTRRRRRCFNECFFGLNREIQKLACTTHPTSKKLSVKLFCVCTMRSVAHLWTCMCVIFFKEYVIWETGWSTIETMKCIIFFFLFWFFISKIIHINTWESPDQYNLSVLSPKASNILFIRTIVARIRSKSTYSQIKRFYCQQEQWHFMKWEWNTHFPRLWRLHKHNALWTK